MNRHHKMLIAWFLVSGLIVFTAVRQIQVAAAEKLRSHQPLPPPAKTRHAIRPVVLPWSGDPVADYVARCTKGMTDKEIRWVIEDLKSADLDQFPFTDGATDEVLVTYLAAQHRWYHAALVDGLRLTREQSAQVAKKLGELFKNAKIDVREKPITGDLNAPVVSRFEIAIPTLWRMREYGFLKASEIDMAPWNLCQLTSNQERLSWRGWFDLSDNTDKRDYETRMEDAGRQFNERKGEPRFWFRDPFYVNSANTQGLKIPNWITEANIFLPLLANQKILLGPPQMDPFAETVDDGVVSLLKNISLLHPAQFKLVLLFRPELAGEIEGALEKTSH